MLNKLILILACLFISGCYAPRERGSIPLALSLNSYASPKAVVRKLGIKMSDLEVIEDIKKDQSDPRPSYHRMVVIVRHIFDLNVPCSARLTFFNESLTSICIYPQNPEQYKQKFKQKFGFDVSQSGNLLPSGNVARFGTDHEGKFYVSFEDPVLENEHGKWIRDNA